MIVYKVKKQRLTDLAKSKKPKVDEVLIVQSSDTNPNIWIPSPLTHFIRHTHKGNSVNTKKKTALIICNFMNYLYKQIELGEDPVFENIKNDGLFGLNFKHLARYINYISNKDDAPNSYKTVKSKEGVLFRFYEFLNQLEITGNHAKISRVPAHSKSDYNNSNKRANMLIVSPFDNNPDYHIDYPNKNMKVNSTLKDMDKDVWTAFIRYASEHYPEIALGVAFQIMGGIRMGEVVNLTVDAVETLRDKNHIRLSIDDRQDELFISRGVNTEYSQVKVPREDQPVFNFNGRLFELWDDHLEYLTSHSKQSNTNSLFVNSYGKPMTGEVYQKKFKQLKWNFINFIGQEKTSLAEHFRRHTWGTHIGRHIFTNYIIKHGLITKNSTGRPDIKLLMILRGDSSEKSAQTYIDVRAVTNAIVDKIGEISKIAMSM